MYAYLKGKVTRIGTDFIIVETNEIGYYIYVPNPYSYTLNEITTIYTHLIVRDDAHELYGFRTYEEKDLFMKLIKVTGIGPKTAIAILAPGDYQSIVKAIEAGDVTYLQKFPKVGPKTAQQIILDLKGKLITIETETMSDAMKDAYEALTALGYKDKEIERVFREITDKNLTTQEYITQALKLMLK
ncbi:MAG: Holliday junction branch migration protein RuvA [Bacilli bacterium]|nr:Holliday junction branch migration protein RuvA [Bacilli bacterium]